MEEIELQILNEYKKFPIPNAVYKSEKSIDFVYIMFHVFDSYLDAVLNNKYLKGFKEKKFLDIKEAADELCYQIRDAKEYEEVKHYFDLYFKSVDIVKRELLKLKNK